jgi:ADP-heptose:LPS heptosyltransferase
VRDVQTNMAAAPLPVRPPKTVGVFRALQLGDLLCAVPALRALRASWPGARFTLIGLPWARAFVDRFGRYLDDFLEFPGYPGLPERPFEPATFPGFVRTAHQRGFDLALQMHGCGTLTNPLVALLGARQTAGYFVPGQFCPDPGHFLPYPHALPEIWRHLRLVEFLGLPLRGEDLEFPLDERDERAFDGLPAARDLRGRYYVVVHPGARAARRRWPPSHFAAVADALAAEGLRVVLTGSSGEAPLTRTVADLMAAPALDLAGQTDLGALGVLLRGARLLVCNDTGVSHVAAALRVPSVVVFDRMSDREGWPPLDRVRHRVVAGVAGVAPQAVFAQARELLGSPGERRGVSPPCPHPGPERIPTRRPNAPPLAAAGH